MDDRRSNQDESAPSQPSDPPLAPGYPTLAKQMTGARPKIHFRTFLAEVVELQMLAQAEIIEKIKTYRSIQYRDSTSLEGERRNYTRDFRKMGRSVEQYRVGGELRGQLNAFMDTSIRLQHMCNLPDVNRVDDLYGVQDFMGVQAGTGGTLTGSDCHVWGTYDQRTNYAPDLAALVPRFRNDVDRLSRWAAETTAGLLGYIKQPEPGSIANNSDDDAVQRVIVAIHCTLAALIPMASVVTLYFVEHGGTRLAILTVSDLIFIWSLAALSSKPRISEVFAVSAAFLAVGIVFIGGGSNGISGVNSN